MYLASWKTEKNRSGPMPTDLAWAPFVWRTCEGEVFFAAGRMRQGRRRYNLEGGEYAEYLFDAKKWRGIMRGSSLGVAWQERA